MNRCTKKYYLLIFIIFSIACSNEIKSDADEHGSNWEKQFDEQLELSGHRNWILVVDKAFPQQPGMHIINTGEKLLPVLEKVLQKIRSSAHVKPVVFNDAELQYISDSLAPGAEDYKTRLKKVLNEITVTPLLHDTVFVQMDAASKLFSVTVLKTEEVIPYSSVFIQLDCAYWSSEKEQRLRQLMKNQGN
ncbi:MAG: hypothetical protein SFU87_04740 [Chitinophagaceae bacterium]|nr:hypothetical protein [Chitinophagaceae bacterium]